MGVCWDTGMEAAVTPAPTLLRRCLHLLTPAAAAGGSPNDVAGVLDDVFSACGSAALSGRMTAGAAPRAVG